jgi:large subunit ribosomal protein L15
VEFNEINLDQLTAFPAQSEVNVETLAMARLLRDDRNPVVILGRGEIKVPLKVRVQRVSKGARAKIEAAGGSVEIVE